MKAGQLLLISTVLILVVAGCVRRDGRNSDCRWPGETPNHSAGARHLSADAEFAEDLAIRYADAHFGIRSPNPSESYPTERDQCMARLFAEIGKEHGVPIEQVAASLGQNRTHIDIAEILPFALLYTLGGILCARTIWRRYTPTENGWAPGVTMALFTSLVFAAGSTLFGEQWNWFVESHRIGNNHMSYRADRLFWARHRPELFVAGLLIFWLVTTSTALSMRSNISTGSGQ